jgi:hypothetical protein
MSATVKIPVDAKHSDRWSNDLSDALDRAVASYDLSNSAYFEPLSDLSAATEFDGIDVDSSSAVVAGEDWRAPGTVYVTLVYEPNSIEPVRINDSYPTVVHFKVEEDRIKIKKIDVDVRSFYE